MREGRKEMERGREREGRKEMERGRERERRGGRERKKGLTPVSGSTLKKWCDMKTLSFLLSLRGLRSVS